MKIELWQIGKTSFSYLEEGIQLYQKRLKHYTPFQILTLPDIKNGGKLTEAALKEAEGQAVLQKLQQEDWLILLDENGKSYDSVAFSELLQGWMLARHKRLIFLIGGAYGFSDALYGRANHQISLSSMTFSHQMVRLFFVEQLYRAFTILRNEHYHHR